MYNVHIQICTYVYNGMPINRIVVTQVHTDNNVYVNTRVEKHII